MTDTTDDTKRLELPPSGVDGLRDVLDTIGIDDTQVTGITVEYERATLEEPTEEQDDEPEQTPSEQTETEPPEPKKSEPQAKTDLPSVDVGEPLDYGGRKYAILKHAEQHTDGGEWVTPRTIAETIELAPAVVSGHLGEFDDQDLAKRQQRADMKSTAYEYKITLHGRELLRRSEQQQTAQ